MNLHETAVSCLNKATSANGEPEQTQEQTQDRNRNSREIKPETGNKTQTIVALAK